MNKTPNPGFCGLEFWLLGIGVFLKFVICYLLFVICHLSFVIRPQLYLELNALRQRQCSTIVDRSGLSPHVGFPGIGT